MSKSRVAALGAGAASAALIGTVLLAPSAIADSAEDSAYAIAADGILDIDKTPHVVGEGEKSVLAVDLPPETGDLVHLGVLNAKASDGYAKASVAEAKIGLPGAPVIEAELIAAECDNLQGSTSLLNLRIGDQEIKVDQIPENQAVVPEPLEGIASITLNKQVKNDDGSLTVTALSVDLLKSVQNSDLLGQSVDIASATCTKSDGGDDTTPPTTTTPPNDGDNGGDDGNGGGGNGGADEPNADGTAPTPISQPGHIAVTG